MWSKLPEKGLWQVADRAGAGRGVGPAPFELLKLDLRGREAGGARGTVRARNLETRLGRLRLAAPDRFVAVYDIRGQHGVIEGTLRPDGSLRLVLSGTANGTFVARAAEWAETDDPTPARALAGAEDALRGRAGAALTAAA